MSDTAEFPIARARDLETELNYLAAGIERPRIYTDAAPPGEPQSTFATESHTVRVRDVRAATEQASLDRQGFALMRHTSAVRDFWDEEEIRTRFYPEVEAAIAAATGASRVVIFDHTLRLHVPDPGVRSAGGCRRLRPRTAASHARPGGRAAGRRGGGGIVVGTRPHGIPHLLRRSR
jgi:hypothetical protein